MLWFCFVWFCGFMRQIDLLDLFIVSSSWGGQGALWFGFVGRMLWIYETDRFVGFVSSSWGGQPVLWC